MFFTAIIAIIASLSFIISSLAAAMLPDGLGSDLIGFGWNYYGFCLLSYLPNGSISSQLLGRRSFLLTVIFAGS